MDWIFWDVVEVYAMAAEVRSFLVSSISAVLPAFFLVFLLAMILKISHDFFGKDGMF